MKLFAWIFVLIFAFAVVSTASAASISHKKPRSDQAAKKMVKKSREVRPSNHKANHRVPSKAQIKSFRKRSDMPYKDYVTGNFKGTTDEILQWTAAKWRIDLNLVRATAAVESWWQMNTLGDNGDSFGLFQMRVPFHCCQPIMSRDAAFNADYWGGIIRAYYDGKMPWLNTVSGNGKTYKKGDVYGSLGAWASGRWHDARSKTYTDQVKSYKKQKVWTQENFITAEGVKP